MIEGREKRTKWGKEGVEDVRGRGRNRRIKEKQGEYPLLTVINTYSISKLKYILFSFYSE